MSLVAYMIVTFFITLVFIVLALVFLFLNSQLSEDQNKLGFTNLKEWQVFVAVLFVLFFLQLLAVMPGVFRVPTVTIQMAGLVMLLTVLCVYFTARTWSTAKIKGAHIDANPLAPILYVAWGFAALSIILNICLYFGVDQALVNDYA